MEISSELLFFFSAMGAFNGLLLGLYFLFYAKPKHISNQFLGALLLTLSVRIGKSVIFYFKPDLAWIYLQLGLSVCLFIGPFLFFYIRSMVKPESHIKTNWKYHVMALLVLVTVIGYLFPFETNVSLWRPYVIWAIYSVWTIYIIASGFDSLPIFQKFLKRDERLNGVETWILSVFIGNLLVCVAFWLFNYTSYIAGALMFSFILYLLLLSLVFNKKRKSILFNSVPKYGAKKIEDEEANELTNKLNRVLTTEEFFKNADITLPEVADKLKITPHHLSQLLNDNLEKSFPYYINEFRIEAAKAMIKSRPDLSLEGIGYECGFNSKSTFYTAFKKHAGTTPAKYMEEHK